MVPDETCGAPLNHVHSRRLAVFTKSLDSPDLKRRLSTHIGRQAAYECYTHLITATIQAAQNFNTTIYVGGPVRNRTWLQKLPVRSQSEGDLGARMLACFNDGVTVLVGGDCPLMTRTYIESAFEALTTHDVVLGPAEDGGYVLIGMNHTYPELFENIPWSTCKVLRSTIDVANRIHLNVHCLDVVWDVDDEQNYKRWLKWRTRPHC